MELFENASGNGPEIQEIASKREPEVCPVCGKMAEYVERFPNGRWMSSHGSRPRTVRGILVQAAIVCHGNERRQG